MIISKCNYKLYTVFLFIVVVFFLLLFLSILFILIFFFLFCVFGFCCLRSLCWKAETIRQLGFSCNSICLPSLLIYAYRKHAQTYKTFRFYSLRLLLNILLYFFFFCSHVYTTAIIVISSKPKWTSHSRFYDYSSI